MKNDKLKRWPRGPFYGFGAAGIGLGTTVQTLTGDWYWSPVILAIGVALGALVSWRIGRS